MRTKAVRRAGPSGPQRSPFECRFDRDGCGRIALTRRGFNHGRNQEGARRPEKVYGSADSYLGGAASPAGRRSACRADRNPGDLNAMQHPELTRALAGEQLRGLMRSAHAYRQAASAHDARRRGRIPRPSRGIGQLLVDRCRTQSPSARTSDRRAPVCVTGPRRWLDDVVLRAAVGRRSYGQPARPVGLSMDDTHF